ncbi:MAG: ABC transporter permease [Oscillospiraceae bacterium]
MGKYLLKRLLQMIPVLLIISIGIFSIVELMPGDPINAYIGENSRMSPEQIERMRVSLGLDGNVVQRYFSWLKNMVTGQFGTSTTYRQPVVSLLGSFIGNTFLLNIVTTAIAFTLALFIGIRSAVKRGGVFDSAWTLFTLIFISIPTFVFGLLLMFIFPVKLGVLPLNGMVTPGYNYPSTFAKVLDIGYHMILPGTVLICVSLAQYVRYIRNSMLDVIGQDYIRTARAKGLSEKVVIYKHALRNAMIPIVTLLGSSIAGLFSGALMLETIFSWPGMGKVMVDSINQRDTPVMLVMFLFYALMQLVGNLLADVGYAMVDPRVKLDS